MTKVSLYYSSVLCSVSLAFLVCGPVRGQSIYSSKEVKLTKLAISRLWFHTQPFDYKSSDGMGSFKREAPKQLDFSATDQKSLEADYLACKLFSSLFIHASNDFVDELEYRKQLINMAKIGGEIGNLARFSLAERLEIAGDIDGAIIEYEKASADQDLRKECLFREARGFFKKNDIDESLRRAELVNQMPPASYETLSLLAELYDRTGKKEKETAINKSLLEVLKNIDAHISQDNQSLKEIWQKRAQILEQKLASEK